MVEMQFVHADMPEMNSGSLDLHCVSDLQGDVERPAQRTPQADGSDESDLCCTRSRSVRVLHLRAALARGGGNIMACHADIFRLRP
jgi:hypothetical protein